MSDSPSTYEDVSGVTCSNNDFDPSVIINFSCLFRMKVARKHHPTPPLQKQRSSQKR